MSRLATIVKVTTGAGIVSRAVAGRQVNVMGSGRDRTRAVEPGAEGRGPAAVVIRLGVRAGVRTGETR